MRWTQVEADSMLLILYVVNLAKCTRQSPLCREVVK